MACEEPDGYANAMAIHTIHEVRIIFNTRSPFEVRQESVPAGLYTTASEAALGQTNDACFKGTIRSPNH